MGKTSLAIFCGTRTPAMENRAIESDHFIVNFLRRKEGTKSILSRKRHMIVCAHYCSAKSFIIT